MAEKMHASQVLEGLRREFLDSLRPEKTRTSPRAAGLCARAADARPAAAVSRRLCMKPGAHPERLHVYRRTPVFQDPRGRFCRAATQCWPRGGLQRANDGDDAPEAVARVAALMAAPRATPLCTRPRTQRSTSGVGRVHGRRARSSATCNACWTRAALLSTRLWVAVRPCGSDENATGAVSPTPLLRRTPTACCLACLAETRRVF